VQKVAEDLFILSEGPNHFFNQYLVDDVLVDSGNRSAKRKLLRELKDAELSAHMVTHSHPDHQGSSPAVCKEFDIPFWCGEIEKPFAESGIPKIKHRKYAIERGVSKVLNEYLWTTPKMRVDRTLKEGDSVGSFTVIETPGHTEGHISLWRESDRTVIVGDAMLNFQILSGRPGLTGAMPTFTYDVPENNRSVKKILDLNPQLLCFGHGPPLKAGSELDEFTERLLKQTHDTATASAVNP